MNIPAHIDRLIDAVLYEGHILYPYRASSIKNCRERFTFGRVYPQVYSHSVNGAERSVARVECLLHCERAVPDLEVELRFLQPMWREIRRPGPGAHPGPVVPELTVAGKSYQTWQEAIAQRVPMPVPHHITEAPTRLTFQFPASKMSEPVEDEAGQIAAIVQRRHEALDGVLEVLLKPVAESVFKLQVSVLNETPVPASQLGSQDEVIMRTLASTHFILHSADSQFISLTDPPAKVKELANQCQNVGVWPVLAGDPSAADRHYLLASPIILPDYPQIASESAGDFCDATEIDQMLALRVITLTPGEQLEMENTDSFARGILHRARDISGDDFMKMHGTLREVKEVEAFFNPAQRIDNAAVDGTVLRAGDRVRIRPKRTADAIDLLLAGRTAVIESVEQDAEAGIHLALVIDDDPGREFGLLRQPGHRFFYAADEVEPVTEDAA